MLRQRLITAAVLIAIIYVSLFYFSAMQFSVVLGAFVVLGAWEWSVLAGVRSIVLKSLYVALIAILGLGLSYLAERNETYLLYVAFAGAAWWIYATFELGYGVSRDKGVLARPVTSVVAGIFVLIPPWVTSVYMKAEGVNAPLLLLMLYLVVWGADTAAYFSGKNFGKHKLAPEISPGKTIEGVIGGVVAALVITLVFWSFDTAFPRDQLLIILAGIVLTVLASVVGDLTESRVKRIAGQKDSGTIFPGHGGALDRIDALTAAAPVFTCIWLLVGKFAS